MLAERRAFCFYLFFKNPTAHEPIKQIRLTQTTLAPAGVSRKYEATKPKLKHITGRIDDMITTPLKLFITLIEVIAGKTISAEINSVPINLNPTTMVTAERSAKILS